MSGSVHGLRVNLTWELTSYPVPVSWMLVEDMKFLSQSLGTLLFTAKSVERASCSYGFPMPHKSHGSGMVPMMNAYTHSVLQERNTEFGGVPIFTVNRVAYF